MRAVNQVHVIGAGGIGCAVGYALRAAGVPVLFVDADRDKVRWGRSRGVGVGRHPPLPADFEHFHDWSPPPGATVLLCTKCYDNPAVLARLPRPVTLIPIQNGFDRLLDDFRSSPEGIASFVSECPPGRTWTQITRRGQLHVGYRGGRGDAGKVEAIARLQATRLFGLRLVPDILPYKYSKLMYNAAISPLAASAGIDNGRLLSVPLARQLFFALLAENHRILTDAGVPLGKVGPFHPDTVARILRRSGLAHVLAWAFYPSLRGTYCSMANDLPAGRTEIDYYNRHLIDLAGDRPCPLNRRVYELVKHMEQQRLPPHAGVLRQLSQGMIDHFSAPKTWV